MHKAISCPFWRANKSPSFTQSQVNEEYYKVRITGRVDPKTDVVDALID